MDTTEIIEALQRLLENEQDARNTLADKMEQNQKLATSAERLADGFTCIYGNLQRAKCRVEKFQTAIDSLKTTI